MEARDHSTFDLEDALQLIPGEGWAYIPELEKFVLSRDLGTRLGLQPMIPLHSSRVVRCLDSRDLRDFLYRWFESLGSGQPFDGSHLLRLADGETRKSRLIAKPVQQRDGTVRWYGSCVAHTPAVASDIIQGGTRLQRFVAHVPWPIWVADEIGRALYFNPAFALQIGMEPINTQANQMQILLSSLAHPDDQAKVELTLRLGLEAGVPFRLKYRQQRPDGGFGWVAGLTTPMKDSGGAIRKWYGIWDDVDEDAASHEALLDRERQLLLMLQSLPAVVWEMEPDGRTRFFNRRPEPFQHFDSLNVIEGTTELLAAMRDSIHPDDQDQLAAGIEHSIDTNVGWHLRYRRRNGDGWRWLEGRTKPLFDESGQLLRWYGMAIDVDDEVRANENLRLAREDLSRLARVASLAELSASIAHEISQPLASVAANAGAVCRWLAADNRNIDKATLSAEHVYRDANLATNIIERIRTMFQLKQGIKSVMPIDVIISEACSIYSQEEVERTTTLNLTLDPTEPMAVVDSLQIRQVLINLLRNASEAMRDLEPSSHVIDITTGRRDDEIVISLEDRGPGIADPDRVFETFYTTKPLGTGLGLPICRTIVALHGGRIWADNTDRGARVFFTLKLAS